MIEKLYKEYPKVMEALDTEKPSNLSEQGCKALIEVLSFGTGSAIRCRKQSISEGAMIALGISKRQEFYNQELRHWR